MSGSARPRPAWVTELNRMGHNVGGAARLVDLDVTGLLDTARAVTGLDAFGGEGFLAPLRLLVADLDAHADLHLIGRLLVRTEILRCLVNRLRLTDLRRHHPEIDNERIVAPVFVTGTGRSGTSILHELLAQDPRHRAPLSWEMLYPCPVSDAHDDERKRRAMGDADMVFWEQVAPEYRTMHENGGDVPQECIFITAHEFASDFWGGQYWVPQYSAWLAGADLTSAYTFHRSFLQVLQWQQPTAQWVLKAPSHIAALPALFAVYPDARVVITHRDPVKVLGSLGSLIGTLEWMRSDSVHPERMRAVVYGFAMLLEHITNLRDAGALPTGQIVDVRYRDLMDSPWDTLQHTYEQLGLPYTREAEERMRAYLAAKPKDRHGAHRYDLAEIGIDVAEVRELYRSYQARYDVPSET